MHTKLGQVLSRYMERSGISNIRELARQLDVSHTLVANIIRHEPKDIRFSSLEKIAEGMGLTTDELLREANFISQNGNHLPSGMQAILKELDIDYLHIAKDAQEKEISPAQLKSLLQLILDLRR